jgi:hypothetical protein
MAMEYQFAIAVRIAVLSLTFVRWGVRDQVGSGLIEWRIEGMLLTPIIAYARFSVFLGNLSKELVHFAKWYVILVWRCRASYCPA